MRLRILEVARDDLIEGFHFYEDKEKGSGDYFLSSLYSDIETLQIYAGIHRKVYRDLQRFLTAQHQFSSLKPFRGWFPGDWQPSTSARDTVISDWEGFPNDRETVTGRWNTVPSHWDRYPDHR